jgi:hypothetical protein
MQYTMIDRDGKESKLLPAGQFRSWYETGHITEKTLLRLEGAGEAKPIFEYEEFQDLLLSRIPPAPVRPVKVRTSMWAAISLLTGIACLAIGGWGPAIGLAAVISGHLARRKIMDAPTEVIFGKKVALVGLIAGYVGLFMTAFMVWDSLTTDTDICRQRLTNLGRACIRYAADHEHQLPPDFVTLVNKRYVENNELFVCPGTEHVVPLSRRELVRNQYRDYIYLAEGLSLDQISNPGKNVMIVERPSRHMAGAINVVYCDGRAETRYGVKFQAPPKVPAAK